MTIDYSPTMVELGIHKAELQVLVAVITHYMVYQRPVARTVELMKFAESNLTFAASSVVSRLIRKGLLQVVGRNTTFGGEHLLQHTPRAERLLGVQQQCLDAREKFWAEIRGTSRPEAAE